MRNSSCGRSFATSCLCAALLWGAGGFAAGGSELEFEAIHRANPDGSGVEQLVPSHVAEGRESLVLSDQHMYWLGGDFAGGPPVGSLPFVRRAGLEGQNPQDVFGPLAVGDIAIDTESGKIYMTGQSDCIPCGTIFRTNLDGSDAEFLFDAGFPRAIALDSAGGTVCWADEDFNDTHEFAILCGNLGDTAGEVIVLTWADDIAIDPIADKVYWTGEGMVRRANLDGSNVEVLVSGLDTPGGIALDPSGDRMWWTDRALGKIQSASLDGENVQDVVRGHIDPTGLVFLDLTGEADDKIYWLSESSIDNVPAASAWGRRLLIVTLLAAMALLLRRAELARP
jgi:hypothetical protein